MLFFHLNREEITELVGRKTLAAKYRTNLLNQHMALLLEDITITALLPEANK